MYGRQIHMGVANPGDSFKASAGGSGGIAPDQKKATTASDAKDLLKVGSVYTGKVCAVSATNTYTVAIDSPSCQVAGALLASPIVSGMLGFQDSRVLSIDTTVAVVYSNPSFILVGFPSNPPDSVNGGNRSVAWGDPVSRTGDAGRKSSTNVAEDLVAGEFDYDNLFGVGMRFLTAMIAMKAGDRAKVECHLLNDMVRIISSQFHHIHGLGEDLIFDHGRPTLERGYTSYRHELMGKLKESEPLFELNGDEIDKNTIDRVNAQARHRYLEYMGFVGDFIHRFVCDPPESLVNLAQAASGRRAGKAWEHFGADGSYVLQSVSEIRFERVTKIPVFHRKASHESPKTTKARRYRELRRDFLKAWDYGSFDEKDAYRTAYQLRLYARWLTRFQAYSRALQLDEEYDVQSEAASPTPDWNNAEEDRKDTNKDLEYFEAYSSYSILRDGSQVIHDGYGSSAVFSNGNVQVSASRHLELEAAGDIRVSCGGSFFLKARRHIEMSASAGGIILHCYAFFRALCERGSMHLRSDAKAPDAESPDTPKSGVEPPIAPVILDSAILLETGEGKMAIRSEKQISLTVERAPEDQESRSDDECDIIMATKGSFRVRASKYVILGALRDVIMSARHFAQKANKWYADIGEILWDKIQMSPKSGSAQIRRMEVDSLSAQSSIASRRYRGPVPPEGSRYSGGPHGNHIGKLEQDIEWKDTAEKDENAAASLGFTPKAKSDPVAPWEKEAEDARWEFLTDGDYYWDGREERKGALVQTLTQQYIIKDQPEFWGGSDHYDVWTWSSDRLQINKRVGENKLGFGGNASQYQEGAGDNLHEASDKSAKTHGENSTKSSWTTNSVAMRTLKQQ
jgi:hypothetical protein